MKIVENVFYDKTNHPEQTLNIYLPEKNSFSVLIYFHGGGMTGGQKEDAEPFAKYLTAKGIAVVSANYRLYPNAVYPEFVCDAAAAVAWTFKNIHNYGECKKFYIGGTSAGGYLSQLLCFDKKYLAPYGISESKISGYIHDAGQPTSHFNVLHEKGIDSRRVIVDETAPLYHVGENKEYPPMLIIVSDNDMKNRYEQTQLLVSTIKNFEYDMTKVKLQVMHGNHCQYIWEADENSDNIFGKLVYQFITEFNK